METKNYIVKVRDGANVYIDVNYNHTLMNQKNSNLILTSLMSRKAIFLILSLRYETFY